MRLRAQHTAVLLNGLAAHRHDVRGPRPEDVDVARVEAVDFFNHAILRSRHEAAPFLRQESDEAEIETVEKVPIGIDDAVCGLVIHAAADVNRRKGGEKQPVRRKKWPVHLKNSFGSLQRTAITGA